MRVGPEINRPSRHGLGLVRFDSVRYQTGHQTDYMAGLIRPTICSASLLGSYQLGPVLKTAGMSRNVVNDHVRHLSKFCGIPSSLDSFFF
jgi:hypothetical protein